MQADILAKNQFVMMGPHLGTLVLVVCVTDSNTSNSTDIQDAASRCNPTNKSLGNRSSSFSFNYQREVDPTSPKVSGKQLFDWWKAGTLIDYSRGPATPVSHDIVETGTGYITQADEADPVDGIATGSITITATVDPVQTVTP